METLKKIKDLVEKMSVDTQKVYEKGNRSASIRARKYAQEIKQLIGVYRREVLEEMPPFLGGGEMIKEVTFEKTTYNEIPFKFEAGTPNIADVIAFKAALDFIQELTKPKIRAHEDGLLAYANDLISGIKGFIPVGTAKEKVSVLSFNINGMHPFDVGQMLDAKGIAVRTGHHCTQPLMKRFEIEGTVRASFAVYNTKLEVEKLAEGVAQIARLKNK